MKSISKRIAGLARSAVGKDPVAPWHASELQVSPGIQRRAVMIELARELRPHAVPLSLKERLAPEAWAVGLPDIGIFVLQSRPKVSLQLIGGGDNDDPLGRSIDSVAEAVSVSQAHADAAITWLEAALSEGARFSDGRTAKELLARLVAQVISQVTCVYAFGEYEERIIVDALMGQERRSRLDEIAQRVFALPNLEWLSADPDSAYLQESVYQGSARQWRARYVIGAPPRITECNWEITSQVPFDTWLGFSVASPSDLMLSEEDIRYEHRFDDLTDGALEGEQAHWQDVKATAQVFGDDCDDIDADSLVKGSVRDDLRIYRLESIEDLRGVVEKYPARQAWATGGSMGTWGGASGVPTMTVDWVRFAKDYDGVAMSVVAGLDIAYAPFEVTTEFGSGTAMLTGMAPGSTLYVTDPR